jgi:hypothetical protein
MFLPPLVFQWPTVRRLLSLVALAACLVGPRASAHDSLSPPGARHNWLPTEDWSAFHWSPFDELRLAHLLGITHRELYDYQSNDHQTLADLALSRGISARKLREDLLAPWKGHVSRAQLRVLRNHTSRMLTQGHLAQHMFWHPFHSPAFMRKPDEAAHDLFGVSIKTYRRLRRDGWTELQIAARGGRTRAQLRRTITHHMEMEAAMGVQMQMTPPSQAARMLARQKSLINCWMSKPLPRFDPDIPFGDPLSHHGEHDRNSKVGIVFPKPAAGCWLPLVPLD